MVKEPKIIKNLFSDEEYVKLADYLVNKPKLKEMYDGGFGRYCFVDSLIDEYAKKLIPVAREVFGSNDLLPSYSLFAHYEGNASLYRHKDDNACTYTLDMCVYQNQPWDLGVQHNGQDFKYTLNPNEALAYYGNDQEHWRDAFPNPGNQHVAMIFFHFVEPDHWYYTEGPEYLQVIRGQISEEGWNAKK